MKFIFLGDVVGEPGRDVIRAAIPLLRETYAPDFFIVNGENAAGGNGITPKLAIELMRAGADVVTLGDHAWDQRDIVPFFATEPRLIRPGNFPPGTPGAGSIVVSGNGHKLGVINLLGRTFMGPQVDNPFLMLEAEIERLKQETACIMIDFHAEATSEKIAFGRAADGLATLVVGTHTHVQTADERILPGGTAYLTDATLLPNKFYIAREGLQADGVFVEADPATGRALRIERIQQKIEPAA
jgi:metallophosphoesterase (TIGR00282 family)